jgi:hypothetical protein
MLVPLLFPVLFPILLNGFEVVCGAKVNDPEGGAGAKLKFEALDGGEEALVLKFDAPVVLLLLPKGVENGLFRPPICPKRFDVDPLESDGEPDVGTPPWSLPLGALSL